MNKVFLAILWHQHQPYYKDLVTGEMLMPWVRLHGIKDYIGMVDVLDEFPSLKLNFNLVPSLIDQLDDYIRGACTERHLELARKDADSLEEDEIKAILDSFFMANWENMINSHPRYGELLARRNFERRSVDKVWRKFTHQELRDLQVWANLAWFHPLVIERDPFLKSLVEKDRDYAEDDKQAMLAKQMDVLARVLPKHRELQDQGRIEVSTTPYYHPILPLLCDMRSAHRALPRMKLPDVKGDWKEDARRQLQMAARLYREKFGREPRGLWPSEGSVSPEMLTLAVEAGFAWMATDEEILARSLDLPMYRDCSQRINRPDVLYQPYNVRSDDAVIRMIFRDHYLSDLVGFKYQWMPPEDAANDLLTRLWNIRQSAPHNDHFVAIILDGENAWEHYRNSGLDFLRTLYRRITNEQWLETVTISDYLHHRPPGVTIGNLFSGSWIGHNFATWVGHPEKNTGWECISHTRAFLTTVKAADPAKQEALDAAWQELYIAEGSDWFWWYGDDHFSGNDEAFDELFRKHLKNVYTLVGHEPPQFLDNVIIRIDRQALYSQPRAFLDVRIDGRQTSFFEWAPAGHYDFRRDHGTMHKVSDNIVSDVFFGFNQSTFFIRFDPAMEMTEDEQQPIEIHVWFMNKVKGDLMLRVSDLALGFPKLTLEGPNLSGPMMLESVAFKRTLELGCPFELLCCSEGDKLEFFVEVKRNGKTAQRIPENTVIAFTVPSKDFERVMWQV